MEPVIGVCPVCGLDDVELSERNGVWIIDEHMNPETGEDCNGIYFEPVARPVGIQPDDDADETIFFAPT
ncbi:MAG: hypothetical protein Q7S80_02900 [bacterium]|nr:hypothetical protein [bacterium]